MLRNLRAKLSYANVMSTVAVFMLLGGSAYAATQLPKNSVGSKQIKSNAVTSSKVKNGSLLSKDFKAGQLPAGPKGSKGDTGAAGAAGAPGAPGVSGYEIVQGEPFTVTGNTQGGGTASCPAGKRALGGGVAGGGSTASTEVHLNGSYPISATVWRGWVNNTSIATVTSKVYVICGVVTD